MKMEQWNNTIMISSNNAQQTLLSKSNNDVYEPLIPSPCRYICMLSVQNFINGTTTDTSLNYSPPNSSVEHINTRKPHTRSDIMSLSASCSLCDTHTPWDSFCLAHVFKSRNCSCAIKYCPFPFKQNQPALLSDYTVSILILNTTLCHIIHPSTSTRLPHQN